jgi:hypothetical protein
MAQELLASYRFGYELRFWSFDGEVVSLRVKPARNAEDKVRHRPMDVCQLLSSRSVSVGAGRRCRC